MPADRSQTGDFAVRFPRPPPPPFDSWPTHLVVRPYGVGSDQAIYLWYSIEARWMAVALRCDVVDIVVSRALVCAVNALVDVFVERGGREASAYSDWTEVSDIHIDAMNYQRQRVGPYLHRVRVGKNCVAMRLTPFTRMIWAVFGRVLGTVTGARIVLLGDRRALTAQFVEDGHVAPDEDQPRLRRVQALIDQVDFAAVDPNPISTNRRARS